MDAEYIIQIKSALQHKRKFWKSTKKIYLQRKKNESVWLEICNMNHNARVFQTIIVVNLHHIYLDTCYKRLENSSIVFSI